MLERLARAGETLVATRSTSPRALPAEELAAARANRYFDTVEVEPDPRRALAAREGSRPTAPSSSTGSLYLLADLLR